MKWFWLIVKKALEDKEYIDFKTLWEVANMPYIDEIALYRFYMNLPPDQHVHDFVEGTEDD